MKGTVGHRGLQHVLLFSTHCDLQAPPDGERGEVQQKQLSTASQAPEQFPTWNLVVETTY